jgi:hypothetical protein
MPDERTDQLACKCGQRSDGWPGKNGGELCQTCWEEECNESWWAFMNRLNNLTPEEVATVMELLPTDALEWGVKFEALSVGGEEAKNG